MKITINGQVKTYAEPLDITGVLEAEGYGGKLIAVALNGTFVAKDRRTQTKLNDGDALEIVAPMQGG